MTIALIVGLGNPGKQYAETRHNAGVWFVNALAQRYKQPLVFDAKRSGWIARVNHDNGTFRLFVPQSYMNVCGLPVAAFIRFYKVPLSEVLIAHDELDFPPGVVKLKQDGGHAGHNGLRDIIRHLHGNTAFRRLRIGIGHPGHRDKVSDYVLSKPALDDKIKITGAIDQALAWSPAFAIHAC